MQLDGFDRQITRIYVPVDFGAHERGASPAQTFGAVGRAPKGIPPERLKRYRAGVMLYRSSGMSVREICAVSGLEVRSFYRYMKSEGIELKRRNEVNGQSETESAPAPDPTSGPEL